jgi:hypothetical protein
MGAQQLAWDVYLQGCMGLPRRAVAEKGEKRRQIGMTRLDVLFQSGPLLVTDAFELQTA